MLDPAQDPLKQIASARPANEAEVETKIVLPLLRLLGYSEVDRADKVPIRMRFGREVREKKADFVLYDGPERSLVNALVTVETKRMGESLVGAEDQARSYATWAGTPFILVCNGQSVMTAQFLPGASHVESFTVPLEDLATHIDRLRAIVGRNETVLAKERLSYLSIYLPDIENLPSAQFFSEYLLRLHQRFSNYSLPSGPLHAPRGGEVVLLRIPVTTRPIGNAGDRDVGVNEFRQLLRNTHAQIYIDGAPGSGKTTLSRRLAAALAQDALVVGGDGGIPIYLDARRGLPVSITAAFRQACEELGVRVFPELYKRSLANGRVLLLLDGLDELPAVSDAVPAVERLLSDNLLSGVLLTSRPGWAESHRIVFDRQRFERYQVRGLNDAELEIVLREYLADPAQASRLLRRASAGYIPELRSPMIALMAIRVANEIQDWESLSIFELYRAYVGVLHRFFNAATVRGRGVLPVPDDHLLAALSDAAVKLRDSRAAGYHIALGELNLVLGQQHDGTVSAALMNCGLLTTSESGGAMFVHRTFEDFGVAWRLVTDFRRGGAQGLLHRHVTDDAYRIAASILGEDDEHSLLAALVHPDRRARRRGIGLLSRMRFSDEAVAEVQRLIGSEKSKTVWTAMARMLIQARPAALDAWLQIEFQRLSARRLSSLSWAIRTSGDARFLAPVLAAIRNTRSRHLSLTAFDLALQVDDPSLADTLVVLYPSLTGSTRAAICRMLGRPTALRDLIVPRLLRVEASPSRVTELLSMSSIYALAANPSAIVHATASLGGSPMLGARPRRRLRDVARRIRETPTDVEELIALAEVCERVGAKREGNTSDHEPGDPHVR